MVEHRAPDEADQHRGAEVAVDLPEHPGVRPALEHSGEPARDAIAPLPYDLPLSEEHPCLALLHQPEEGQVTGERLDDGLDHPRQRHGRWELRPLDALEPPDQEHEVYG